MDSSDNLPELNRLLDRPGDDEPSRGYEADGLQTVVRRARAYRVRRLTVAASVAAVLAVGSGVGVAVGSASHHAATSSAGRQSHSSAANGPIVAPPAPHVSTNIGGGAVKPSLPAGPPGCATPAAAPLFSRRTNGGIELIVYPPGPGGAGWVRPAGGQMTVQLPSDVGSAPTAAVYPMGVDTFVAVLVVRDTGPGPATWRAGITDAMTPGDDAMTPVDGYVVLLLPLFKPPAAPGLLGTYTADASNWAPGQPVPVTGVHSGSGNAQHCYEISLPSSQRG